MTVQPSTTPLPIVVHHLENSRSQRVLWLLEELGVPYSLQVYKRDPKTSLAPQELKRVHPLGKSPVVVDGGVTVAESGAIVEYLIDTHGHGRMRPPPGTLEHRRYTYWLHFAEGSMMPPLLMKLVFARVLQSAPFFVKPVAKSIADRVGRLLIEPNLAAQMQLIEGELSGSAWFAGADISGADIQMSFPLEAAASRMDSVSRFPKMQSWLARIHARPAYQRALQRGGPYTVG